ncbi:MAG: cytochrome b/b6 domain-containing protein [Planctomycetota bacterium]
MRQSSSRSESLVHSTCSIIYLFVLVMVVTGLMLYFKEKVGLPGNVAKGIKEYHELLTLFFIAFVPLHIVAVIIAENTNEPGIVSAMIHGKRPRDPDSVKTD